ncbi:MAG: hypothetical protein ACTSQO_13660 [Candidatus Helarchaeota archaeon]
MDNNLENACNNCGKVHEKKNIDLLPTWLQCKKCGRLYCVDCAHTSIQRISIEKLLMAIIVILFLYIGVFILEDLRVPLTTATIWGVLMTLLPVGAQMLLLKYHEKNTFKENKVLKKCLHCSAPLHTLYHDSILNSWLFTIYAFNILVFLFEFFFKLYNFYDKMVPEVIFMSSVGVILWIIFLIIILLGSIVLSLRLYRYILSSFQTSYRIWVIIIIIYTISLYFSLFCIELNYILLSFGFLNIEITNIFNIIFTMTFAGIPKLFWFVPAFLMSAFLYCYTKRYLMNHKSSNWLKLVVGFFIITIPLIIWGIFYPYFYNLWENLISWSISNFIFNFLFGLSIFSIVKRIKQNEKKVNLKVVFSSLAVISVLILYLLFPIISKIILISYFNIYVFIITLIVVIFVLFELFNSWFNENKIWRAKIMKNLPDPTYLIIVGTFSYCIALNSFYLIFLSPMHPFYFVDISGAFVFDPGFFSFISIIGLFGIIAASVFKLLIKLMT